MREAEKLFNAITAVRADLVEEAQDHVFRKKSIPWRRMTALAACLLFAVGIGFGALRLGVIGGVGGSDNKSAETADNCAPMAPEESGGVDAGEGTPQEPEAVPERTFTATVLEVHETYLLVEALEGQQITGLLGVPTLEPEAMPELQVGDRVTVTFAGEILEIYPAKITGVLEIVPAE